MKTSGTFQTDLKEAVLAMDSNTVDVIAGYSGDTNSAEYSASVLALREAIVNHLVVQLDPKKVEDSCGFDEVVKIVNTRYCEIMLEIVS